MASPLGTEPCGQPPCTDAVFHDASYFADLWPRIYPIAYLEPLKDPGPGYEVLSAYAVVFARVSLAIARLDCGAHILDSFGGALANGNVQFTRSDNLAGDVTIRAGTIVSTSSGGRRYLTLENAAFIGADLGPVMVPVAAVRPGWEFNVPGRRVAASGEVLLGEIDTITLLDAMLVPSNVRPIGSPTFFVTNVGDICGGRQPMLDGLGADRGLARFAGESDVAYKRRIRQLPETVSPDAIINAASALFQPYGYALDFIENWQPEYQTAYDVTGMEPGIDGNLFCYDDPRPAWPPFRNRWLSEEDFRGAFIVVVPNIGAIRDVGMAYDDTAAGPTAVSPDTSGLRAISAYDVTQITPILQGAYDGFDLQKQGVYISLYQLLDRIKAAGVYFAVELRGE